MLPNHPPQLPKSQQSLHSPALHPQQSQQNLRPPNPQNQTPWPKSLLLVRLQTQRPPAAPKHKRASLHLQRTFPRHPVPKQLQPRPPAPRKQWAALLNLERKPEEQEPPAEVAVELPAPALKAEPENTSVSTPEPVSAPVSEALREPTPEPVREPTPEPVREPTPEPVREPTPEPVREPTPEPAREPTPEPIREPTPEPAREPTPEPIREPTPEPVREPTPEPVREPTPEPAREPTPEPIWEPSPQPLSQPSAEPGLGAESVHEPASSVQPSAQLDLDKFGESADDTLPSLGTTVMSPPCSPPGPVSPVREPQDAFSLLDTHIQSDPWDSNQLLASSDAVSQSTVNVLNFQTEEESENKEHFEPLLSPLEC
uniref:Proteoglycan 4-like n=1 Tax=Mastacembelus armatus TaxID=205130 RepID=A0A7N8WZE8_9TELE